MLVSDSYEAQGRRACELVYAYIEQEITLGELEDVMCTLASEAVQTMGAAIHGWEVSWPTDSRLLTARHVCMRVASSSRVCN